MIISNNNIPYDLYIQSKQQITNDIYPWHYGFTIKPNRNITFYYEKPSIDFPLIKLEVANNGIKMINKHKIDLNKPSDESIKSAIENILPNIVTKFKNPILMLCRSIYTYKYFKSISKYNAGIWGIEYFNEKWKKVIMESLIEYKNGNKEKIEKHKIMDFYKECKNEIAFQPAAGAVK